MIRGAWDDGLIAECKNDFNYLVWDGEKGDFLRVSGKKFGNKFVPGLNDGLIALTDFAASPGFLTWLEDLTGIKGLLPDPTLKGGGAHRIGRGGFLKMHTDFNYHEQLRLYRRLNLLLYLNEGWDGEWAGSLWLGRAQDRGYAVAPEANTMVIFETSDRSWHGHPEPLRCPEGVYRDSIALYYYTADPPPGFGEKRMTTNYDA